MSHREEAALATERAYRPGILASGVLAKQNVLESNSRGLLKSLRHSLSSSLAL